MNRKAVVLLALLVSSCVPAIVGVSFAMGGATVAVTYEVLGERDAGRD